MKKTTKEKAPQPEKEPYVDPFELEDLIGRDRAKPFIERLDAAEKEQEEAQREKTAAEERLAQAKEAERFAYRMMQAALDRVRNVDLSDVLAAKPYDHDLRAILAKMDLTESGAWDQAARRYAKNPIPGVAAWEELVAAGATDVQIMTNLTKGFGGFDGKASGTHTLLKGNLWRGGMHDAGNKPILKDKALVAEVRRLLSIPLPPKPAPAAKAKPAAKAPAKSKAAKKTQEVEELAETSIPPTAPLKTFGEWAHSVKKVMKRRGLDAAAVKEERPWTGWHSTRMAPARAVAEWEGLQKIPDPAPPASAGKPVLPAARVIELSPCVPIDGNVSYDAIELGVSDGDIAAAVDRHDFASTIGVPVLSAIVRHDGDLYVVRTQEHIGGEGLILRPLVRNAGGLRPTKADPLLGRAVIMNNETRYIGPEDDGIRVDDKAPAAGKEVIGPPNLGKGYWQAVKLETIARDQGVTFRGISKLANMDVETLGQLAALMADDQVALAKSVGQKTLETLVAAVRAWLASREFDGLPDALTGDKSAEGGEADGAPATKDEFNCDPAWREVSVRDIGLSKPLQQRLLEGHGVTTAGALHDLVTEEGSEGRLLQSGFRSNELRRIGDELATLREHYRSGKGYPGSDPVSDEEIADDRDPPADPPPAPPVYRDHTLTRAQLQNAMAVDAVLRDKPVRDCLVYRSRSYVVSGFADLDDGKVTHWHLHPTLRPDEWDGPTETPIFRRANAQRGRPIAWEGLEVLGESGNRIILGRESERITLETPGPKAAAAEPAAKGSKKKAAAV